MKILIIEDEKLLADSVKMLLERKGFEVECVYDGKTGEQYAELGVYDLLILDVMMPEMDGYQVAREVRAKRCSTPILMLTAKSGLEDMPVLDDDRDGFYRFIRGHLKPSGIALICTMGDGDHEMQSDIRKAFEIQEREHPSGKLRVTGTSCRMVSFHTLEKELLRSRLSVLEKGITSAMPNFNSLMYAVVQKDPQAR